MDAGFADSELLTEEGCLLADATRAVSVATDDVLCFRLPFGWPGFVEEFASYVAAIVSFDFGSLTSPECLVRRRRDALSMRHNIPIRTSQS